MDNHQINLAEEYYKVSVFILTDLRDRFLIKILDVFQLSGFIPEILLKKMSYCCSDTNAFK